MKMHFIELEYVYELPSVNCEFTVSAFFQPLDTNLSSSFLQMLPFFYMENG